MSKNALIVLVILLAALVGGIWMSGKRESAPDGKSAAATGTLLPAVDMATVTAIVLADSSSTTHLARVDGIWCVAEQDNVPADFTRLRAMMLAIDGLEPGQIVETGGDHLADYGLAVEAEPAPMRITLEHAQGTTVLSLGKLREPRAGEQPWGPSPGRYVRVDEGPVRLLKEAVPMAQADPDQWWDRLLLEVAPESIQQVEVSQADSTYSIQRGTNGVFELAGASADETVDEPAAQRLFGALRSLRAVRRLPADAEAHSAAFTNASQYRAVAEGISYAITVGAVPAEGDGTRPVKIEVAASAEATPEQQARAAAAMKKLSGRAFAVPAYLADALRLGKDEVVKPSPPVLEQPPVPAEAPPEATAPSE